MSTTTFDKFVKRRIDEAKSGTAPKDVDWNQRREDWISSLNDLYSKFERYLKKYTKADQIQILRESIQISENNLGSYDVDKLTFQIGNDEVIAEPIGTQVIGAAGRVDLIGAQGRLRLVLLDKGEPAIQMKIEIGEKAEEETTKPVIPRSITRKRDWYIATMPPRVSTIKLNADVFRDALVELSDD